MTLPPSRLAEIERRHAALRQSLQLDPPDARSWLWRIQLRVQAFLLRRYRGDVPDAAPPPEPPAPPPLPSALEAARPPAPSIPPPDRAMPHDVMEFRRTSHARIGSTLRRLETVDDVVRSTAEAQWVRQQRNEAQARRRADEAFRVLVVVFVSIGVIVSVLFNLAMLGWLDTVLRTFLW